MGSQKTGLNNRRKAVCLINSWHPKLYGTTGTLPWPHDGWYNLQNPHGLMRWGVFTPTTNNLLPYYRGSDGSYFPDGPPTIIKKAKSRNNTYVYITLNGTMYNRYFGQGRFATFTLPNNNGPQGLYGSRYPGALNNYTGEDPPWPQDKLYIPCDEIALYRLEFSSSNPLGNDTWSKFTQTISTLGIVQENTQYEPHPKGWKPDPAVYTEWKIREGTPNETTYYYGEFGLDILPKDLPQNGGVVGPYGGGNLMARYSEDSVSNYALGDDFPEPKQFTEFVAFKPNDDGFTWRFYKQDIHWTINAHVVNPCTDCHMKGVNYTISLQYENGTCENSTQGADGGRPFGPVLSFDGDFQTETITAQITDENLEQYTANYPIRIHKLQTINWNDLDWGTARRVIDFTVESVG